jgi:CheY-like chemotaxis protein
MQVLVVEDDAMLAHVLSEVLADDGHVVCGVASTVAEAVTLARRHRPDVGILDMQLRNGECGSDVADQLAQSGDLGQTGILYVTGGPDRVLHEARVGHACLGKPYRLTTLHEAIEIVRDIATAGATSRCLPRGLQLLAEAELRTPSAA